jgi:hypothetical protein
MQKLVRILAALAVVLLAIWLWRYFFPSPEKVIRSRLSDLAATVSVEAGEGNFRKVLHLQKLPDFFTPDVAVVVDIRGYPPVSFEGRDELVRWIMGARQNWNWLKVEFLDVNVTINADGQTAVANFTGKATVPTDRDFFVQEFNFLLKKVDGKWLIYRIESVKTLSLLDRSSSSAAECSMGVVEYWSIEQRARPLLHHSITPFRRTT